MRVGGVSSEGGDRSSDPLHVPKLSCKSKIRVDSRRFTPIHADSCFVPPSQSQIQVQMSMEISPQHHSIVLGKQSSNLKLIMQRTGTQIMFPDAGDPNIPSLKKSNVTITGGIHNVYLARQQLVVGRVVRAISLFYRESINSLSNRTFLKAKGRFFRARCRWS